MSSSSDSEDENLKQILEATDTSFLNDSLFKTKPTKEETPIESKSKEHLPSQRFLNPDENTGVDFLPSETVQRIMGKKLTSLIQEQIEFVTSIELQDKPKKISKNKVRLLSDFDCYVKPFEDFEFEDNGPRKKPKIKKRTVDDDPDSHLDEETKVIQSAIDGEFVLSLKETSTWSERTKGKIFKYKQGKGVNKDQHLIEPQNEFSKARQKNQWNESRIRKAKFLTK